MKRYKLFFIALGSMVTLSLVSCLKTDNQTYTDFSTSPAVVIFASPYSAASGTSIVGLGSLSYANWSFVSSDTATFQFYANYAGLTSAPSDLKVTIGVDDAKRTAYNTANNTKFQPLVAGQYTIPSSITIPKGAQYSSLITVKLINKNIDPTVSYMLPVSITDASGVKLSSNLNTIYFNFIGNPIAAKYNRYYKRWNAADSLGIPALTQNSLIPFIPDDPTTVEVQSGAGSQFGVNLRYLIKFTNTNGVLSNFSVVLNSADVTALTPSTGYTVTANATLISADPIKGHYKFSWAGASSVGAARVFSDEYQK